MRKLIALVPKTLDGTTMKNKLKNFLRIYRAIPTALTLGNVMCGFTAILNVMRIFKVAEEDVVTEVPKILVISAWFIVGALVFDLLDGWTARKLNATSNLGMQMDSLADMVTFGVTPAVMVCALAYRVSDRFVGKDFVWVWILCALYVCCVALRLALYNVIAMKGECSDEFNGLPSPGGAAAVASCIFVYSFCARGGELKGIVASIAGKEVVAKYINTGVIGDCTLNFLPLYAGILALLMVSKVPYKHFGKWLGSKHHNKLKILLLIAFAAAFGTHPLLVTTVCINAYVLWAPLRYMFGFAKSKKSKEGTHDPAPSPAAE